jgi:hypothetical protein
MDFLFSKQIEMGLISFIDRTDRNSGIIKKSHPTSRTPGKVGCRLCVKRDVLVEVACRRWTGVEAVLEVTKDADTFCPYKTLVACELWVGSPCLFHGVPVNIKGAWFGSVFSALTLHISQHRTPGPYSFCASVLRLDI